MNFERRMLEYKGTFLFPPMHCIQCTQNHQLFWRFHIKKDIEVLEHRTYFLKRVSSQTCFVIFHAIQWHTQGVSWEDSSPQMFQKN